MRNELARLNRRGMRDKPPFLQVLSAAALANSPLCGK